jgi:hypothetical protein
MAALRDIFLEERWRGGVRAKMMEKVTIFPRK